MIFSGSASGFLSTLFQNSFFSEFLIENLLRFLNFQGDRTAFPSRISSTGIPDNIPEHLAGFSESSSCDLSKEIFVGFLSGLVLGFLLKWFPVIPSVIFLGTSPGDLPGIPPKVSTGVIAEISTSALPKIYSWVFHEFSAGFITVISSEVSPICFSLISESYLLEFSL